MKYEKTLLSVEITLKGGGTLTVADTVDDPKGTAVWGLIRSGADLLYKDGEDWMYVAHGCICSAKATPSTQEVDKPEDEFCQPIADPCEEPTP